MTRQKRFTIKCAGLALAIFLAAPTLLYADVIMVEKPADGSVRKGEIAGDKLFLYDKAGKRAPAADGMYRGPGGRMIIVIDGKISRQPGPDSQKKAGLLPAEPPEGSGFSGQPGQLKQGPTPHMQGQ